jgi:hypothetical protein
LRTCDLNSSSRDMAALCSVASMRAEVALQNRPPLSVETSE